MSYHHPRHVRRILESLVGVICPPEATELGLERAIVDHAELTMGALPALFRTGLIVGLTGYDAAALLWPAARGRRAHALPLELRTRWFTRWLEGVTPAEREFAKGVKQILALAHYEQPEIQQRMGYTPDAWIDKVKRRRLEVYSADIAKHHASITAPDPLPRMRAVPEEKR